MNYHDIVKDFAKRTKKNLDLMRRLQQENPELEIYEVTQLMNSLLGLLVFPQQRYIKNIPHTPLDYLAAEGWPIPQVVGQFPQVKDLNQLIRYLRNAVAHFNIEFLADGQGQISGLRVWNQWRGKITWRAELSLAEIEELVNRFFALILDETPDWDEHQ